MYNYKEKKAKKLALLTKIGNDFFLSVIRYDSESGEKLEPAVHRLDKEHLIQRKGDFEKEAADLGDILTDMEALDGKK